MFMLTSTHIERMKFLEEATNIYETVTEKEIEGKNLEIKHLVDFLKIKTNIINKLNNHINDGHNERVDLLTQLGVLSTAIKSVYEANAGLTRDFTRQADLVDCLQQINEMQLGMIVEHCPQSEVAKLVGLTIKMREKWKVDSPRVMEKVGGIIKLHGNPIIDEDTSILEPEPKPEPGYTDEELEEDGGLIQNLLTGEEYLEPIPTIFNKPPTLAQKLAAKNSKK